MKKDMVEKADGHTKMKKASGGKPMEKDLLGHFGMLTTA